MVLSSEDDDCGLGMMLCPPEDGVGLRRWRLPFDGVVSDGDGVVFI